MPQEKPIVRIAPNNPVFDLPVIVGIEEKLFDKAGLDVRFTASYADREKDKIEIPVMARMKEQMFDCGSADSYNVCEWASIDRLEKGTRGGNIAALRASVAAQAIITFDETLQVPRDLADVPVVVQQLTGSHYTTLQMLESALGADHVNIASGGLPQRPTRVLRTGSIASSRLWSRLSASASRMALILSQRHSIAGGEVISADLSAEQRKTYYDAENMAVDLINADFYKYAHHVAAHTKGALQPNELLKAFVRYKHVDDDDFDAVQPDLRLDEGARPDRRPKRAFHFGRWLNWAGWSSSIRAIDDLRRSSSLLTGKSNGLIRVCFWVVSGQTVPFKIQRCPLLNCLSANSGRLHCKSSSI